jgi:hypothetical protein
VWLFKERSRGFDGWGVVGCGVDEVYMKFFCICFR